MKFGSPQNQPLDQIDFSLPADHPDNQKLELGADRQFTLYTGCAKWGRPEWVGTVYPDGTKEKEFLAHYLKHFNSIELNATFYNLKRANVESWAEQAKGHDFKFCPKFSRRVSHLKRLGDVEENIDYFIDVCALLGENLGPSFLQMPENFGPKWMERIVAFIERVPQNFPVAIELRHEEWYENPVFDELFDLYKKRNIIPVITDTALRRDVIHQRLTCDTVFIRFNGYGLHETDFSRLDAWAERIQSWRELGVSKVYFFAHQPDEANTPKTADYLIQAVNKRLETSFKSPFD